jgi:hypothetical protein
MTEAAQDMVDGLKRKKENAEGRYVKRKLGERENPFNPWKKTQSKIHSACL